MSLAASIFTKLSDVASATGAIVGTGSACRVYPGIAPAGAAAPYVVAQELYSEPVNTHAAATTHALRTVQFSCVASTYAGALALASAVAADLDNVALAGGELCHSMRAQDGYAEGADLFLRIIDAEFFSAVD